MLAVLLYKYASRRKYRPFAKVVQRFHSLMQPSSFWSTCRFFAVQIVTPLDTRICGYDISSYKTITVAIVPAMTRAQLLWQHKSQSEQHVKIVKWLLYIHEPFYAGSANASICRYCIAIRSCDANKHNYSGSISLVSTQKNDVGCDSSVRNESYFLSSNW